MTLYEDFMRDAEQSAKVWRARRELEHERERQRRARNRAAFWTIVAWTLFFVLCYVLIVLAGSISHA
jgi:hypothetical protein